MDKLHLITEATTNEFKMKIFESAGSDQVLASRLNYVITESALTVLKEATVKGMLKDAKEHIKRNWKKYLAGAVVAGAGAAAYAKKDKLKFAYKGAKAGLHDAGVQKEIDQKTEYAKKAADEYDRLMKDTAIDSKYKEQLQKEKEAALKGYSKEIDELPKKFKVNYS